MFYYLLHNSSFLDKNKNDKQIKLIIYGTIMYIIMHGLIFSTSYLAKLQNYYWLLFALDIGSLYIVLKNGSNGILNINTTFSSDDIKEIPKEKKDEKPLSDEEQQRLVIHDMNTKLSSLKIKPQEKSENKQKKQVRFTEEKPKQTNDLENIKMEIKDTLLSNNKQKKTEMERINRMKKNSATESDTDFGSDIDFDAFEKSLD